MPPSPGDALARALQDLHGDPGLAGERLGPFAPAFPDPAAAARRVEALVDPATGQRCVRKVRSAIASADGPYRFDAPDLLVGYEGGYRNSWECATGAVTEEVFSDNTKSWSGDHCVDPEVVPGVFFSNRAIAVDAPHIADIPVSVLRLFGQKPLHQMKGRMLFATPGQPAEVRGPVEPERILQSGAAPGARVHLPGKDVAHG